MYEKYVLDEIKMFNNTFFIASEPVKIVHIIYDLSYRRNPSINRYDRCRKEAI